MTMTNEEIANAVDGVMALRPKSGEIVSASDRRRIDVARRRRQAENAIEDSKLDRGELETHPVHYFHNTDATKGGRKNPQFNQRGRE